MMTLIFIVFSWAQESTDFVCNPPLAIKDRVNEHCIQASQFAVTYQKPQIKKTARAKDSFNFNLFGHSER